MRWGLLSAVALAAAATAVAATPKPSLVVVPRSGDVNTAFRFKGKGWIPKKRVTATYFTSATATQPYRAYAFKPRADGSFVFRFARPVALVDAGVTSRMCFRQPAQPPRRVCTNFYVAPPAAQFMPSNVKLGDVFMLVVSGFIAGHELQGMLLVPPATERPFVFRARRTDAFVAGAPFGPIFVPRGGAAVRFASSTSDPPGLYTATVTDPAAGSRARAAVMLAQETR